MDLKRLSLGVGIILILVSIVSVVAVAVTPTAFLPGIGGILLIALAILAMQRETLARHAMHGAMLVALLLAIGSLRVFTNPPDNTIVAAAQVVTLAVSLLLVVLGVMSFIQARRARQA